MRPRPTTEIREAPISPQTAEDLKRRVQRATLLASLIIAVTFLLSFEWGADPPAFRPDAGLIILGGIFMASLIYMVARFGSRGPSYFFSAATCPACRRIIPADSNLCPYCGHRLR